MNHNIFLRAIAISLVSNNGKFSYSQTGEMYSKVSSYQVKRWLDKQYACIHALMLLERQNKRGLYEAKKYFQSKFIGVKHNGNKVLRLLAA